MHSNRFRSLDKESQQRLVEYVTFNRDVHSSVLAEELALKPTTVAAIKANVTRKYQ